MVGTDYYFDVNQKLFWAPETAWGVNNGHAQWAVNVNTDTFYWLPLLLKSQPFIQMKRNRVSSSVPGFTDPKYQQNHGYSMGKMTLQGEVYDSRLLLKMCATACTTDQWGYATDTVDHVVGLAAHMTANTAIAVNALVGLTFTASVSGTVYTCASNTASVASVVEITMTADPTADIGHTLTCNQYRHYYITGTARAAPSACPSFAMLYQIENNVAAESVYKLYQGCIISGITWTGPLDGQCTASVEIEFSYWRYGVALNTPPSLPAYGTYHSINAAYTFTKAGTTYLVKHGGFKISYKDGKSLFKASGESYPLGIRAGFRKITVELTHFPYELLPFTDLADLDPNTANNIHLQQKVSRDTATDFIRFFLEHAALLDHTDPTFDSGMLVCTSTWEISAKESGTFTWEEVNTHPSAQY